jgi:hypothetical protein
MKRRRLDLLWVDSSGEKFRAVGLPVDVFTRNKAEYLRFEINVDTTIDIRLDRIKSAYWAKEGTPLLYTRN